MGKIAIIMGPSSCGKDSIFKVLMQNNPYQLQPIVLCTTRPKRDGEIEGKTYYFKTEEEMKKLNADKQIVESRVYDTFYGKWYYFTCNQGITLKDYNYATINTLTAYDQFCAYYGKENIIPIYIELDSGIRLQRALNREIQQQEPKYEEMCRRFLADQQDFSLENIQRRNIINRVDNTGTIEDSVMQIDKILKKYL